MKVRHAAVVLFILLMVPMVFTAVPPGSAQAKTVMRILQPCEPPPTMRTWNVFYSPRPLDMIFEPLFWYSRGERKYYPWLAESMTEETVGELIKVTVKLRKGVKWHDGKEFTALDVLTTYWIIGWVRKWWPLLKFVPKIEAPDDYTVILYVKKEAPPWAIPRWFLTRKPVSYTQYGKFAPGLKVPGEIPLKDVDTEKLLAELKEYKPDKFIGTGPYVYKTFTDTEWVYEKAPYYWVAELGVTWKIKVGKYEYEWGGEDARFDEIHWYRRISDPASWPLIMAGKFDFTWTGLSQLCYETVKAKPGYWAPTGPWLHGHALYFNCEKFPLEVRKAIAYIIDLEEYCTIAIEWGPESVIPAEWPVCISPADVYNWLSKDWLKTWIDKYEYDPDKAAKLLEEAGYTKKDGVWYTPEGEKFSLTVHVPAGWAGWVPGAENIATQLKRFGIDAKVIELDWGMWGKTIREAGAFDLAIDFWTYGLYYPYDSYHRFYYSYTVGVGGLHFDPIVEVPEGVSKYSGKVNATELAEKLGMLLPREEAVELTKALAYITNYYLPVLQLHEKKWANTYNIERVDCAVGWGVLMEAKDLQIEMGNHPGFVYGFIIASGMLRPPPVAPPPPPPIIYVTVYATAEIEAFTGVDGETYGPYKPGDVMVIPKEDADRLIEEGLVSYSPPPPVTYVTVYITKDVPAFTGVDGKTYGPYKPGDAALLPKEDAERLVAEGLASLTPPPAPPPKEIPEIAEAVAGISADVTALKGDVAGVKADVAALAKTVTGVKGDIAALSATVEGIKSNLATVSGDVKTLSETVKTLEGTVAGITSMVYASVAVSVITLILVLITLAIVLRRRS